jgi:hypothetical protein
VQPGGARLGQARSDRRRPKEEEGKREKKEGKKERKKRGKRKRDKKIGKRKIEKRKGNGFRKLGEILEKLGGKGFYEVFRFRASA